MSDIIDRLREIDRVFVQKGFNFHILLDAAEEIRRLTQESEGLRSVLKRYVSAYPAFRMKPEGAPGSPARIEQENLMALEDSAMSALQAGK